MRSPGADDRELVDQIIFDELTRYDFRDSSRAESLRIIRELADSGADAVVLGCTEIGLLVEQRHIPSVPLLDTTVLHVERIVEYATEIDPASSITAAESEIADALRSGVRTGGSTQPWLTSRHELSTEAFTLATKIRRGAPNYVVSRVVTLFTVGGAGQ